MNVLPHLALPYELAIFVASAIAIWVAGIFLSKNTWSHWTDSGSDPGDP